MRADRLIALLLLLRRRQRVTAREANPFGLASKGTVWYPVAGAPCFAWPPLGEVTGP